MEIAAQNRELQIAAEPSFAPITTTPQSVAALQGVDGRLDSRMMLPRLAELDCGRRLLFLGLLRPEHGQTRMSDDLGQFPLIFRRVETAVEGGPPDASLQTLLQSPRLRDDHAPVVGVARHQVGMGDEPGPVLVNQDLPPELHGLGGLAAFVQLGVRLEDTEELFGIGHVLALKHATAGGAANMACSLHKRLQLCLQREDFAADLPLLFQACTQLVRTCEDTLGQGQEFPVEHFDPLLVTLSLAGSEAVDPPHQALRLPVQVLVLPPAAASGQRGDGHTQGQHLPQTVADEAAFLG